MEQIEEKALIEKCILFLTENKTPDVYYNVSVGDASLDGISHDSLISLRDLINKIEMDQKGNRQ